MKTLIAVPCMDMLPVGFVQSLLYMHKGDAPTVYLKPNSLVYDSRNLLSLYAIENKFDNVLWLDSDMMFPPNTLTNLLRHNEDMVSGLYVKRHDPNDPVLYEVIEEPKRNETTGYLEKDIRTYGDYPRDAFFPVAGCGFGCVMMRASILQPIVDRFHDLFAPLPGYGEDLSFCIRAKACGFKIHCDPKLQIGHKGAMIISDESFNAYRKAGGKL